MRYLLILVLSLALLLAPVAHSGASWGDGVAVVIYGSQYGTGWWVAQNTIVTAAHVVSWTPNATVKIVRGDWSTTGVTIYVNEKTDIAVIKTDSMPPTAHIFPVASRVSELKTLFVIGYPFELVQLSRGDVAAASNDPRIARGFAAWYNSDYHLIEFQAITDAGNSGGPVVYSNGAVAGLVSFALNGKAGTLYFASDADAIRAALDNAGVKYQTLDPPVEAAASIEDIQLTTDSNFNFWAATILAVVSIVVTIAWLTTRS